MHNVEEKKLEANWKDEMTGKQKIMHLPLSQNRTSNVCNANPKPCYKMMLKKEWSCNMLKYSLEVDLIPLSTNYKKEETKAITSKGKNFHVNLKWA